MTVMAGSLPKPDVRFAPVKDKRDWYQIPPDWVADIAKTPRVDYTRGVFSVHLSMLPLLAHRPEVRALLDTVYHAAPSQTRRQLIDDNTRARGFALRDYQHVGREFVMERRGTLVADTMRLGKTLMTTSAFSGRDRMLVVGPRVVRDVWLGWVERFHPGIKTLVLTGRKYDEARVASDWDFAFVHYDVLPTWQIAATLRPELLVFDEAHLLSNPRAQRTQAALIMATRASRVVALTGTPLWNKPVGIHPILACLNPGAWGKFYDFAVRYCDGKPGAWGFQAGGVSNADEFQARMGEVMIRRTWQQVSPELPPITRSSVLADVTDDDCRNLDMAAEKVKQANTRRAMIGELSRYRRLVGRLKLPAVVELATQVIDEEHESVVIWTWHKDVARAIAKALGKKHRNVRQVDGETPDPESVFAAARTDSTPNALIVSMGVGQAGIDLSHARQAIFAEVDYTPAVVAQAEMRTFAPSRPMVVTFVMVDHHVDRGLVAALMSKCAKAAQLGLPAAETAIDIVGDAFGLNDQPDMARLAADVLAASYADDSDD